MQIIGALVQRDWVTNGRAAACEETAKPPQPAPSWACGFPSSSAACN